MGIWKITILLIAVMSTTAISAQAVDKDAPAIVVVGNREDQAKSAAEQAKAITLRPTADNPLPHHYAPICIRMFGIDPEYGSLVANRIRANIRTLSRPVAGAGCQSNVWIGFVGNSRDEVALLRKREPAMFASLKSFEIDRILAGSGAAQAWHATEIRSVDGRPIPIVELELGARKTEVKVNSQYSGGRLSSPIRSDINGTIVIFDRVRANGRTVQQLADYATMRILAPVQDFATDTPGAMPSILQLFTPNAVAPDGLTEFDWAYLAAYYKLDRGAKVSAIHDAARQAMLDGTGTKLREKAEADRPTAP